MSRFRRICVASLCATACGWEVMIHQKIGKIAQTILADDQDSARITPRIKHLIKGDLLDAASYGHTHFNVKYPTTTELHMQPMRPDWSCTLGTAQKLPMSQIERYRPCNNGDENHCLLGAMYFFFHKFAHHELLQYNSHIFTPPKNKFPDLKKIMHLDMDDSHVLKWLLTLLGDMHQPLHFGNLGDKYGKDLKVKHQGRVVSLYEYWEKDLPETFEAFQNMEKLVHQPTSPDTSFSEWANESQKLACQIYEQLGVDPETPADKDKVYDISDELHEKWRAMMVTQIQRAGERTALLIMNILDHKKMHEREKEGRPVELHRDRHTSNLLTNLGIAAVFFPLFWIFIKLLERATTKSHIHHSV